MAFADTYFKRFQSKETFINVKPSENLFLIIVIPVFNEPDLISALKSLVDCKLPTNDAEIIVIINSSENSSKDIIEQNRKTYNEALIFSEQYSSNHLKIHILNLENLPHKFAGVGLARKIGMDEALHRFNFLNKPHGLIAGFDADAKVKPNYLKEIENYFFKNPKIDACSVDFQHPISGEAFPKEIYNYIIQYELHLRYFIEALRFINFPFAYQTIGSSFVVKAEMYAKQGGMNRRKAGEDFYFLHKIIQQGNYGEIFSTAVFPSPRISDRVPFGTGAAIKKMTEAAQNEYLTYAMESFLVLKVFFDRKNIFYSQFNYENLNQSVLEFLQLNNFESDIIKIRKESPDLKAFNKKFFEWFNAFRIIKYLNFAHEKHFKKINVLKESKKLLDYKGLNFDETLNAENVLLLYRTFYTQKSDKLIIADAR